MDSELSNDEETRGFKSSSASESFSSSDSEYSPRSKGKSKAKAKRSVAQPKRKRLRGGPKTPTMRQSTQQQQQQQQQQQRQQQEEDESHTVISRSNSKNWRLEAAAVAKPKAPPNWTDDGCYATFCARLDAYEWSLKRHLKSETPCFYYKPAPSDDHETQPDFVDDDAIQPAPDAAFDKEQALEWYHPQDHLVTDSGLMVPKYIYAHLFPHQRECLEWLHQLHEQNTGGILGDDMGLGKTIQIVSFLGAMHHSDRLHAVLLVCPASVLLQWVREFHKWYPLLRIVLLHGSGTGVTLAGRSYKQMVDEVLAYSSSSDQPMGYRGGGVIMTTYECVRQYQQLILDINWDYVVLDEGHRIRNPDAEITLVCKQLKTVHRVILTGTPIQNRLKELWSLFDFVYPGKLGTLPTFEDEFVLPIRQGGYASASKMQVVMAYKCALILKDVIKPFMLRRTKKEIQELTKIPDKMEQVIFCKLTPQQRHEYESFLGSSEVHKVLRLEIRPFRAISILRHICNHPDLLSTVGTAGGNSINNMDENGFGGAHDRPRPGDCDYGRTEASGKMVVLRRILEIWKQQGHRVLLFSQTRKMLDILQNFMDDLRYKWCRLDGTTTVKERQRLLDDFNSADSDIFVFLLTTRAGGIGVNLTGADRVVIFDPDWNPSTDMQARERSWRLGQTKQVTIYRLITCGTIEEKIYHRQIFKQYLTNKVLHDPKRKRCFNKHSLRDLFVLTDQPPSTSQGNETKNSSMDATSTETSSMFLAGHVPVPESPKELAQPVEVPLKEDGATPIEDDPLVQSLGDVAVRVEVAKARRKRVFPVPNGATHSGNDDDEEEVNSFEEDNDPDEFKAIDSVEDEDPDAEEDKDMDQDNGVQENSFILKQLFDGCDVKGFFSHDVVESDGVQNQEAELIEMESDKIAESALKSLRQSCSLIRQQRETAFTPTWTGKSGDAGNPESRRPQIGGRVGLVGRRVPGAGFGSGIGAGLGADRSSGGLSAPFASGALKSKEMLEKIKLRRNAVGASAQRIGDGASGLTPGRRRGSGSGFLTPDQLTKQLHAFLSQQCFVQRSPRGAATEEVLEAFGEIIAPKDKVLFRTLLRQMAVCQGRRWMLRPDYQIES